MLKEIKDLQFGGAMLILLMGKGAKPSQRDVTDVLMPYAKWIGAYVAIDGNSAEAARKAFECTNE